METSSKHICRYFRFSFFAFLLFYPFILSGQDSICIKGFVKDKYDILSDFPITIKHKDISTHTNIRGRFKICCAWGDTLVFYDKKAHYAEETYVVRDTTLVIIELFVPTKITNGKRNIYGHIVKRRSKNSVMYSGTIKDFTQYYIGYKYTFPPWFIERTYIPFYNTFSAGVNLTDRENEMLLFPYIGIPLRSAYHNYDFSLGLFIPHIKLGYYFNISNTKPVSGFGYDLSIDILHFWADFLHRKSFAISLGYNNYTDPAGAVMLGVKLNFSKGKNKLPRIICNINKK